MLLKFSTEVMKQNFNKHILFLLKWSSLIEISFFLQ